ncbi:hypothetical protein FQN54_002042 [Arachnomyces sp. PD_36]|nr:hypothetical protein FQN54_002042 [Arachnomyces sp. PD_36]
MSGDGFTTDRVGQSLGHAGPSRSKVTQAYVDESTELTLNRRAENQWTNTWDTKFMADLSERVGLPGRKQLSTAEIDEEQENHLIGTKRRGASAQLGDTARLEEKLDRIDKKLGVLVSQAAHQRLITWLSGLNQSLLFQKQDPSSRSSGGRQD